MLAEALLYLERGWSIVPLAQETKYPLVSWKPYQTSRAPIALVEAWFKAWPTASIGIITGAISGCAVVDLDGEKGLAHQGRLPETAIVKTGRGLHYYFQYGGQPVENRVDLFPGMDLRGDGGLVAAPPSLHKNGTRYTWLNDAPLAPLPDWVREACMNMRSKCRYEPGSPPRYTPGPMNDTPILEGRRHQHLWTTGRQARWYGAVPNQIERLLWKENATRCMPPLDDDEVRTIIRNVLRTPDRS